MYRGGEEEGKMMCRRMEGGRRQPRGSVCVPLLLFDTSSVFGFFLSVKA
jgi:hypothetical protein